MSVSALGFSQPLLTPRNLYLITGVFAIISIAKIALHQSGSPSEQKKQQKKITKSPRTTVLAKLTKAECAELPYPPDVFPGARDVDSPYGSMRIYEWGPEDGRKVLLIHGITTPCVALGSVASGLVEKGCRVLLFDLFGRGYSDTPDLPHDICLYTTQILLAITSSNLAWTSSGGGFSIVGYSLGGGIAAEFTTHFPDLVTDLVLLAPSGMIRSHHFGWASRAVYSSLIPDALVHWIVGRRLQGASHQKSADENGKKVDDKMETDKVVNAEIKGNRDPAFESAVLSKNRPDVTVASAVQWQVENHAGFVKSFVSSIRHSPIENGNETWRALGKWSKKVLVIAGVSDAVIVCDELKEDILGLAGSDRIVWREIDAGHEFPITKGQEVVDLISEVWQM